MDLHVRQIDVHLKRPLLRLQLNFSLRPQMRDDDDQDAEFLAQGKLIVNEIHHPNILRPDGFLSVGTAKLISLHFSDSEAP